MAAYREGPDAKQVLADLVGKTIPTLTDMPNRVLRLEGDRVIVGTNKSPEGRPVPIPDVQSAIEQLYAAGELAISVQTVGRRSAFIGAVLRQLAGVQTATKPRRAWLV